MTQLRLAVVGTGHLGRIHARIAAASDAIDLLSVVDSRSSAAQEVAEETGAEPLTDYRELFGKVDAAIVATPTKSHAQVAGDLLRGGLHLLVEKPLTATTEEAQQLVELADRQQQVLQVGHVERFNPALTAVRDRLHGPKFIEACRTSSYTFRSTDVGVVMDLMIHDIDAILSLVRSPVEQVDAVGFSVLGEFEDLASVRLRFASGCVAQLAASRVSYTPQRTLHVYTDDCFAAIDFATRQTELVEPRQDVLQRDFRVADLSSGQQQQLRENLFSELLVKTALPITDVNAIEQEQLDFASAIDLGVEPQVSGADGRDAVEVAERILDEIAKHGWDGLESSRRGPLAMPESSVISELDRWSIDDTVVLRRKAG